MVLLEQLTCIEHDHIMYRYEVNEMYMWVIVL